MEGRRMCARERNNQDLREGKSSGCAAVCIGGMEDVTQVQISTKCTCNAWNAVIYQRSHVACIPSPALEQHAGSKDPLTLLAG